MSSDAPADPITGRYSDGETAREHSVEVRLDGDALRLTGEGIDLAWPVSGLKRLPDRPDGAIVLSERGSDARLAIDPACRDAISALLPHLLHPHRVRRGTMLLAGTLTALAAAVVLFLFVGLPALSRPLARTIPLDVEARLGERSDMMVTWFTDECEASEEAQAALDGLGDRLYAVSDSPFEFDLRIVDAAFPNAFALPGGTILVTDELIDEMESPDELAGVLAHEAAHVARRHVMAAQLREMGFGMLLEVVIGGGSGAGQELARTGATLESLRHSRGAEAEADLYALYYLDQADLNPEALADFFDRMQHLIEEEREEVEAEAETDEADATDEPAPAPSSSSRTDGAAGDWLASMLRTHPDTDARADAARRAAADLDWSGAPALTEAEWAALDAVCETGVIRDHQTLERVRERVEDALGRGEDGEEESDAPAEGDRPD